MDKQTKRTKLTRLVTEHDPDLVLAFEDLCKLQGRTKKGYINLLIRNELARNQVKQAKNT